MTDIRIKLIPDGSSQLPVEARDHGVLADKLEGASPSGTPAPDWDEIQRIVTGDSVSLILPDSTVADYDTSALDAYVQALTSINGVKEHPNGWEEGEFTGDTQ